MAASLRTSALSSESSQPPARPLPKFQLAEAAKMAETRRRFDNDRYKCQGESCSGADLQALGISLPSTGVQTPTSSPTHGSLPGLGDLDAEEGEDMPSAAPQDAGARGRSPSPVRKQALRSGSAALRKDAAKANFDADEEALMTEILEDFDVP